MDRIEKKDMKGLLAFMEEHQPKSSYIVSLVPQARQLETPQGSIQVLPLKSFLDKLWSNQII